MSTELTTQDQLPQDLLDKIITTGDLSGLSAPQLSQYYMHKCVSMGLSPSSKPFDVLVLKGKKVLYPGRECAAQLNAIRGVSHKITSRWSENGCYFVSVIAYTPDGRETSNTGGVNINNLVGEDYCNAVMKAETKAKRRATLDLCGLGMIDETERPDATVETEFAPSGEVSSPSITISETKTSSRRTKEQLSEAVTAMKHTLSQADSIETLDAIAKQDPTAFKSCAAEYAERRNQLKAETIPVIVEPAKVISVFNPITGEYDLEPNPEYTGKKNEDAYVCLNGLDSLTSDDACAYYMNVFIKQYGILVNAKLPDYDADLFAACKAKLVEKNMNMADWMKRQTAPAAPAAPTKTDRGVI